MSNQPKRQVYIFRDTTGDNAETVYMSNGDPAWFDDGFFIPFADSIALSGFLDQVQKGECFKAEISFTNLERVV